MLDHEGVRMIVANQKLTSPRGKNNSSLRATGLPPTRAVEITAVPALPFIPPGTFSPAVIKYFFFPGHVFPSGVSFAQLFALMCFPNVLCPAACRQLLFAFCRSICDS